MIDGPTPANRDTRFWDRHAPGYAQDPVKDPEGYERTLSRVRELLDGDDRVLEIGCGTGSTALRLAPLVARYHATDLSPAMIAIATEKLVDEPRPTLTFAAASDIDPIALPAGGYDAVLAFNLLHLVEDLDASLAAARELLRPGGLCISKTVCLTELNFAIRMAIPLMRLVGKAPSNLLTFNDDSLIQAFTRAGFTVEAVERHGATDKDPRVFIVARRPAD